MRCITCILLSSTSPKNPVAHFPPPSYLSCTSSSLTSFTLANLGLLLKSSIYRGCGRGGKRRAYLSPSGANPLSHCISGAPQHVRGDVEARQLSSLAEHLAQDIGYGSSVFALREKAGEARGGRDADRCHYLRAIIRYC